VEKIQQVSRLRVFCRSKLSKHVIKFALLRSLIPRSDDGERVLPETIRTPSNVRDEHDGAESVEVEKRRLMQNSNEANDGIHRSRDVSVLNGGQEVP
jgi:hypothetical protein